jgi:hypothetical protein
MTEEDEEFEQMALKQGHWQHTSGWRKKQIMDTQAFPNPHRTDVTGMALRDYFAAKAIESLIALLPSITEINEPHLAKWSYKIADAMLKARGQA